MNRVMKRICAPLVPALLFVCLVAPALAQSEGGLAQLPGTPPTATGDKLDPVTGKPATLPNNNSKNRRRDLTQNSNAVASAERVGGNDNKSSAAGTTPAPPTDENKLPDAADSSFFSVGNILLLVSVILVLLMVALHIVHLMSGARLKQQMAETHGGLMRLRQQVQQLNDQLLNFSARAQSRVPAAGPAAEQVVASLDEQERAIAQLADRLEDVRRELSGNLETTARAVALHKQLAGAAQLRRQQQVAADERLESERQQAAIITEKYREVFGTNANAVKPLIDAFAAFSDRIKHRPYLPEELASRLQGLDEEIRQFDRWHAEADAQLVSLRRGSLAERLRAFRSREQKLGEAFTLGDITVFDYVKQHDALMQEYVADDGRAAGSVLPPTEQENQFRRLAGSAPDHLMNWFDKLFQLQTQFNAAASVDPQTSEELTLVQQLAKDALGRFDIQPEEIQPGRTSFDNRLYDAALVSQSSQYPANTVIGVQQCGFRRRSNGELLRRPKVIVAGLGAAS
jgi:molecular chaperone GrpE (heat shock protein)